MRSRFCSFLVASMLALPALAQWNPSAGQWGKVAPTDLRVMQWNIQDGICRTANKAEGALKWCATARIVAAMKPDILLIQEVGDNSGNGSGSGVDSVAQLTTTLNLFINGGTDPVNGGTVGSYVKKYDPNFDLPYVVVGTVTDGFNRNVILSRYPFADLNGDGTSVFHNFFMTSAAWAPGGNAGIRGMIFAEINLPDNIYRGNLVACTAHLRSGSEASDITERQTASKNISYFIDAIYNGLGTNTPDPNNRVSDNPAVPRILDAYTPVIWTGDLNEDENTNGRDGPALWLIRGGVSGSPPAVTDGTDRDRSDSTYDDARVVFNPSDRSTQSSSKLDYVSWQDSIATLRQAFIYRSNNVTNAQQPPEIIGFNSAFLTTISGTASDHRPVIADFILPAAVTAPTAFTLASPADAVEAVQPDLSLSWNASTGADSYTVKVSANADLSSPVYSTSTTGTSLSVPAGTLSFCGTYYWGVSATNSAGSTASSPLSRQFKVRQAYDLNADGLVDDGDFVIFAECYEAFVVPPANPLCDVTGDSLVDDSDFVQFAEQYEAFICP